MEKPKPEQIDNRKAEAIQSYWAVIWDQAWCCCSSRMVKAVDDEQAEIEAIKLINAENDYGPDEDGGFTVIEVYDRADLLALAAAMESSDKD